MTVNPTVPTDPPEREPVHYWPGNFDLRTGCGAFTGDVTWTGRASRDAAEVTCPACLDVLDRAASPLATKHTALVTDLAGTLRLDEGIAAIRRAWDDNDAVQADYEASHSAPAVYPECPASLAPAEPPVAAAFPELAPPVGPVPPPAEHRTVGLEVLTDELRAAHDVHGGTVGIVLRADGQPVDVPEIDTAWLAEWRKPADILAILLRQARHYADGGIDGEGGELLMPTPDVLAALAGGPLGRYTAPIALTYEHLKAGWLVEVETDHGGGDRRTEWLLVDDVSKCDRVDDCIIADGHANFCRKVTIHGRGIQHLETWRPVTVRIPADSEVTA